MLTGVLPYETPSPAELAKLMTGEMVAPPRTHNPKLPRAVNDIVMKALAPSVSNRYQRAADLLADVLALGKDTSDAAVRTHARAGILGRGRDVGATAGDSQPFAGP